VGTLFVVATPIGNLDDVSPRALSVLRDVSLIAAEDTRHTGKLLRHFGIDTATISYHAHNERGRRERLLEALAAGDVALVTDAGTPGISDPGNDLVRAALEAGFPVSPIPGPSAAVAAVSASGLVPGPFMMLGFLPRDHGPRRALLARAAGTGFPLVLFEAPTRAAATAQALVAALGDRPVVMARELTKLHEEVWTGSLAGLAERLAAVPPRGEIVLVVGGDDANAAAGVAEDPAVVVAGLRRAGLGVSEAAREAARLTGLPKSELYGIARAWVPESENEAHEG
jgi:16S rRNA (cytidine1402-2'-O)-methyltransferase